FHADRWDYVFTLQRQKVDPQARRVSVFFKDNVMERVESEQLPSEAEFVSTLSANAPPKVTPVLEASPEALAAFPVARKPAPTGAVVGAPASYPPLEPAATK
ncbi:MAG: outer membrane protein assembly factor BamE domain-containing protein, partial [Rhodoferax sp.]